MKRLTNEVLKVGIFRAYETAKKQGFYDNEFMTLHHLMMIVTEIGEVVQADRHDKMGNVKDYLLSKNSLGIVKAYKTHLEGTVQSELADICIRCMSLLGYFNEKKPIDIVSDNDIEDIAEAYDYRVIRHHFAIPEIMYSLTQEITCNALEVSPDWMVSAKLQVVIAEVYAIAKQYDIDLVESIFAKIEYNEYRMKLHGCKY